MNVSFYILVIVFSYVFHCGALVLCVMLILSSSRSCGRISMSDGVWVEALVVVATFLVCVALVSAGVSMVFRLRAKFFICSFSSLYLLLFSSSNCLNPSSILSSLSILSLQFLAFFSNFADKGYSISNHLLPIGPRGLSPIIDPPNRTFFF